MPGRYIRACLSEIHVKAGAIPTCGPCVHIRAVQTKYVQRGPPGSTYTCIADITARSATHAPGQHLYTS
jgi:hypothetical protein